MNGNKIRSADGTAIAYDMKGLPSDPVIIRIDGAATYRALDPGRSEYTNRLSRRFQVVSYDRRGRGDSEDSDVYSVEREIEDVAALLEHFGGRGFVLGLSSGAVLALRCVGAGLPIDGLACYEPPFVVSSDRAPLSPDYVDRLHQAITAGRAGDAVKTFMTEAVGMPASMVDTMSGLPFWSALEQIGHTLIYDAHIMGETMQGRPEAISAFATVGVPALVMSGEASEPWLHEAARQLVEHVPNATMSTLLGQTHQVDPAVLADIVGSYFSSLPAGSSK